jgi:hypothetical protein
MRDLTNIICTQAMFDLIAPDSTVPVKVELEYSVRDPYAVQASFRTGNTSAVVWVFARDLLADGLSEPSGDGDVRVAPMAHDPGRVELVLNSPSGHATFTTCAATLAEFLERTYEAVPPGAEYSWLDFDAALTSLLDNDPARD